MEKLKLLILACLAIATFTGCDESETQSVVGTALQGIHQLKSLSIITYSQGTGTSGYFTLIGSLEGQVVQSTKIRFAWVDNQGLVSLSELPVTKLKFHFNPKNNTPTIKFRWRPDNWAHNTQEIMDNNVIYAVIDCKETDIPSNTSMSLKQVLEKQ